MKTLPAGLPPVPSGYVYLGLGGSFKTLLPSNIPNAASISPDLLENSWSIMNGYWSGDSTIRHYAAPADSEIVRLNTPPAALDLSKLPIGTRVKYRDGGEGVFIGRATALVFHTRPTDAHANYRNAHFANGCGNTVGIQLPHDVVEVLDQPPSELEALKVRVAVLEKDLAEGKAKTCAAAPAKWEPRHLVGGYTQNYQRNKPAFIQPYSRWFGPLMKMGRIFKTPEACSSAEDYRTFFSRLLNLAAELNPSGLVGGQFYVATVVGADWKAHEWCGLHRDCTCIFETLEVAKKAADILNRDGWKVPSLPSK